MDHYGLTNSDIKKLLQVFDAVSGIETVWIYGSRAKGDFRKGSDVDLAVSFGKQNTTAFRTLKSVLEDLPFLYHIDIVDIDALEKNSDFYRELQSTKKPLYENTF